MDLSACFIRTSYHCQLKKEKGCLELRPQLLEYLVQMSLCTLGPPCNPFACSSPGVIWRTKADRLGASCHARGSASQGEWRQAAVLYKLDRLYIVRFCCVSHLEVVSPQSCLLHQFQQVQLTHHKAWLSPAVMMGKALGGRGKTYLGVMGKV